MKNYNLMVTGHRPHKLPPNSEEVIKVILSAKIQQTLLVHPNLNLISGMAIGVDTWFTEIGLKMGIPTHAVIPFKEQASRWSFEEQKHYSKLLKCVKSVTVVSNRPTIKSYFDRNIIMVNKSNECLAICNDSKSGTAHAIKIAKERGLPIKIFNPNNKETMRFNEKIYQSRDGAK